MKWKPHTYIENSQMQFSIGKLGIDRLKPQKSEKILDLGCGIGNLTTIIAEKTAPGCVIGIDPDTEMINYAQENLTLNPHPNLSFIAMNGLDIMFQQEFDAIFTNMVLHWIRPIQALLKNIYNALIPGGRIQFGALFDEDPLDSEEDEKEKDSINRKTKIVEIENRFLMEFVAKGYSKDILSIEEFQGYQSHVNPNLAYQVYKLQRWEDLLKTAGFRDIRIEHQIFWQEFTDLEKYLEYRKSNIWLFFWGIFQKKYRDQIAVKLASVIRTEWNALPPVKKEWPYKEKWPVLFIHAKK